MKKFLILIPLVSFAECSFQNLQNEGFLSAEKPTKAQKDPGPFMGDCRYVSLNNTLALYYTHENNKGTKIELAKGSFELKYTQSANKVCVKSS